MIVKKEFTIMCFAGLSTEGVGVGRCPDFELYLERRFILFLEWQLARSFTAHSSFEDNSGIEPNQ